MLLKKLWVDELGATVSLETVMVGTVGVLAVTGGIAALADAVNDELGEMALAVRGFDQSYAVTGYQTNGTLTTGVPCTNTNGAASATFQAFKSGSGFVQTPPNINIQQTNGGSGFGQVDLGGNIGGRQFVQQPQVVQPQSVQPQFVPQPTSILLNTTQPQSATIQHFDTESVEVLRNVPVDDQNAVRGSRTNRITGEECKPSR